uniref:Uncharacterized protein n=1 Tax=Molossus molossus TaxID=27622 RepID=A0A7J8GLU5_MOLMO|nr:hypothetical protein HJG59_011418 [Molossus molossus]
MHMPPLFWQERFPGKAEPGADTGERQRVTDRSALSESRTVSLGLSAPQAGPARRGPAPERPEPWPRAGLDGSGHSSPCRRVSRKPVAPQASGFSLSPEQQMEVAPMFQAAVDRAPRPDPRAAVSGVSSRVFEPGRRRHKVSRNRGSPSPGWASVLSAILWVTRGSTLLYRDL